MENELSDQIKKINEQKKEKWGFDFSKGEPIEGTNIEWVNIKDDVTIVPSCSSSETECLQFDTKVYLLIVLFFSRLQVAHSTRFMLTICVDF